MSKSKAKSKSVKYTHAGFTAYREAQMALLVEELAVRETVRAAYDQDTLAAICTMPERDFAEAYEMVTMKVLSRPTEEDSNFYHFRDNGSKVLAVAHLDTVGAAHTRAAHFLDTEAGPVVFSRALDDRLGAYTILELLPALGLNFDILLTVGEEEGRSTAEFFCPPKEYDWMIEFDRGGTDVVMYQYEDDATADLVEAAGARVGSGSFSDIAYLEHLLVKGFNWGIGYTGDYHGPRAHAFLDDTFKMVAQFLKFHEQNNGVTLHHEEERAWWKSVTHGDHDEHDNWGDDEGALIDARWLDEDQGDDLIAEYPSLAQMNEALQDG